MRKLLSIFITTLLLTHGGFAGYRKTKPYALNPPLGTTLDSSSLQALGLTLFLATNEGSGGTLNDSSFSKNQGALSGTYNWATSPTGTVIHFDGSSGYASIPDNASLDFAYTHPFSYGASFQIDSTYTGVGDIIAKGIVSADANQFDGYRVLFVGSSNSTQVALGVGSCLLVDIIGHYPASWLRVTTPQNSTLAGKFNQVTVTYDGTGLSGSSAMRVYVNGVSQTLTNWGATLSSDPINTHPLTLGRNFDGPQPNFAPAQITRAFVYNRQLSANEAREKYINPMGIFNSPRFDFIVPAGSPFIFGPRVPTTINNGTLFNGVFY